MKADLLVFAAHPDDAELSCSGTICKMVSEGKKVVIADLTKGEMGTRGTAETRKNESDAATSILQLMARENLDLGDVTFETGHTNILKVAAIIRKYRPEVVFANAISDRHPDHGKAAELVKKAFFIAGLRKIELTGLDAWTPKNLFHYIQDRYINPDFIVDISSFWGKKLESIKVFKTQFYDPNSTDPDTYISSPDFLLALEARARSFGHAIGTAYGEGFTSDKKVGVNSPFDLL